MVVDMNITDGKKTEIRYRCGHTETHTFAYSQAGYAAELKVTASALTQSCSACGATNYSTTRKVTSSYARAMQLLDVKYTTPLCASREKLRWVNDVQWRTMPIVDLLRKRITAMHDADPDVCDAALRVIMPTLVSLSGVFGLSARTILDSRYSNWMSLCVCSLRNAGLESAALWIGGTQDANK